MYKIVTCFLIGLLSLGLTINEASAKRFGGGRSFGVQRSKSNLFNQQKAKPSKTASQKSNASKWGGMLGGLLIGGLLGSLFFGNGLGSGLISWLIIGSLIFFLVSMFRKRMQPAFQSANIAGFRSTDFNNQRDNTSFHSGHSSSNVPYGFESEAFLRNAKVTFNRLQSAYDQKNLNDLQTFTAPEVFGEIKMQLDERSEAASQTEVMQLEAELLDVSQEANGWIASVRFTGFVKENNEPMAQLDEIWHFRQFAKGSDWMVGGIQQ